MHPELKPDYRPRVFIASSTEGREVALQLQAELEESLSVEVWSQDAFRNLPDMRSSLTEAFEQFDFGICVLTPDSDATIRGAKKRIPNLNVLLEIGLFFGHLGADRVFVVKPKSPDLVIPSDLNGWLVKEYEPLKSATRSMVASICGEIVDAVWQRSAEANAFDPVMLAGSHERRHRGAVLMHLGESLPLVAERCARSVKIDDHGDAELQDVLTGVTTQGLEVCSLPSEVHADTGQPSGPVLKVLKANREDQTVQWVWRDPEATGPVFPGATVFLPPLTGESVVTYSRTQYVSNAYVWTVQDALAATDGARAYEQLYHSVRFAAREMEISAVFPRGRFRDWFELHAYAPASHGGFVEDHMETARLRDAVKRDEKNRRVTAFIKLPLWGYRYELRWNLDNTDEYTAGPHELHRRYAFELMDRMLAAHAMHGPEIQEAVRELKRTLFSVYGEDVERLGETECQLFLLDRHCSGLRCVASVDNGARHDFMGFLFRPGQGMAGRTFRRRECQPYKNMPDEQIALHTCVPLPKRPTGLMPGIPVLSANGDARPLGCVALHDASGTGRLQRTFTDEQLQTRLTRVVTRWFDELLRKVGSGESRAFWQQQH